jgi:hypothetical protein
LTPNAPLQVWPHTCKALPRFKRGQTYHYLSITFFFLIHVSTIYCYVHSSFLI